MNNRFKTPFPKKKVDEYLREVNYDFEGYIPSLETLKFVNFIKEVNGGEEENETPVVHMKMIDNVFSPVRRHAILAHRGVAKALHIDTPILTPNGYVPMKDIEVGMKVINRNSEEVTVTNKSDTFTNQAYKITLEDGSSFIANEDHIHILQRRSSTIVDGKKINRFVEEELTTKEMLERGYRYNRTITEKNPKGYEIKYNIPLISKPVIFNNQYETIIDPYTVGVILSNGSIDEATGFTRISTHTEDVDEIRSNIPYELSDITIDKMSNYGCSFSIKKIGMLIKQFVGTNNTYSKAIPKEILYGSVNDRLECLRGLMDTDGTISKTGLPSFTTVSEPLAEGIVHLIKSLGGYARYKWHKQANSKYRDYCNITVSLQDMNPFKLSRKANMWKPNRHYKSGERVGIINIEPIEHTVETQCITVDCKTNSYLINNCIVTHNSSIFGEYLLLWIASFGYIPNFGKVPLSLYVSDSIENGVKNLRRNVEFRFQNSEYLEWLIPRKRLTVGSADGRRVDLKYYEEAVHDIKGGYKFTDIRLEFENRKGQQFVNKGYGVGTGVRGPLALNELVYMDNGTKTISEVEISDMIHTPYGVKSMVVGKSDIFDDPMYELVFADGRKLKTNHDHINPLYVIREKRAKGKRERFYKQIKITTEELLDKKLKGKYYTKIPEPLNFPKKDFLLDPYLVGLALGDGYMPYSKGLRISGMFEDVKFYRSMLTSYSINSTEYDERSGIKMLRISIKGVTEQLRNLKLAGVHGKDKFIPEEYLFGSIEQRRELLAGLLDTDGSCSTDGRISFTNISRKLVDGVAELARGLGYIVSMSIYANREGNRSDLYRLYIRGRTNPFKLPRKADRWKEPQVFSGYVSLMEINRIDDEPSQCIEIDHPKHEFITTGVLATHNTKEKGTRPYLAILDDLISSDDEARSKIILQSIKNTIYKDVSKALHPKFQKIIYVGTPFNQSDPLYEAIESGAWKPSVFPICEHFDANTTKETFKGSWEDRFPFEYAQSEYIEAIASLQPQAFYQELMLRITSTEDLLLEESDIGWYDSVDLIELNKSNYNFYIVTDLAVTAKASADYSVILVFAFSNEGILYYVNGFMEKVTIDKSIDKIFEFVKHYNPFEIGIEKSGQQGAIVTIIQKEAYRRGLYSLRLGRDKGSKEFGFNSTVDKVTRFNSVVPMFKNNMVKFPRDKADSKILTIGLEQIKLINPKGYSTKNDDFGDAIAMLSKLTLVKPDIQKPQKIITELNPYDKYFDDETTPTNNNENIISSYLN